MKLPVVIDALRKGASVKNETGLKWAGVAVAGGLVALSVVQSFGLLADVTGEQVAQAIMAALVLYAQIATTTKIGILPEARSRGADGQPDGVRDGAMPTDAAQSARADGLKSRSADGFPTGPFFDT